MFFIIRNKNKICLHNSLCKYKIASGLNSYKYDYLIEEGKHFKAFALCCQSLLEIFYQCIIPSKKIPPKQNNN